MGTVQLQKLRKVFVLTCASQDKRVSVIFQQCAWVDTKAALQIADLYKKDPAFIERRRRLLICDNLDAHLATSFIQAIEEDIGDLHFLPPNLTHMIQPSRLIEQSAIHLLIFYTQLMLAQVALSSTTWATPWTPN